MRHTCAEDGGLWYKQIPLPPSFCSHDLRELTKFHYFEWILQISQDFLIAHPGRRSCMCREWGGRVYTYTPTPHSLRNFTFRIKYWNLMKFLKNIRRENGLDSLLNSLLKNNENLKMWRGCDFQTARAGMFGTIRICAESGGVGYINIPLPPTICAISLFEWIIEISWNF